MWNKFRLILIWVFAALTFYQFYTFANAFKLSDFYPRSPAILYGFMPATPLSARPHFDPSILLLALNIVLSVERPNRIRRAPLILAFIANLAIVILRVGIAAPQIKLASAAPLNNSENLWALSDLYAKWNAAYLILAAVSALIVLGMIIHFYLSDPIFRSSLLLRATAVWGRLEMAPVPAKAKVGLLLVFSTLTFYQLYMYARITAYKPSPSPDISSLNIPQGTRADVYVVDNRAPRFSFDPISVLLILNLMLLAQHPQSIGRRLLIFAFVVHLSIVIIRVALAAPTLELAEASTSYYFVPDMRELERLRALWNMVYLIAASISSLIVLWMLIYLLRKR